MMRAENFTSERGFILLGLTSHRKQQIMLFVIFLTIYLLTISGNLLIILLVRIDAHLHTPMYFFLSQLSGLEIMYVTSTVPQTLAHLLAGNGEISSTRCMLQGSIALGTGCMECLLLGVMAYDRYLAICSPLRYSSAMDETHRMLLATVCWTISCLVSITYASFVFHHPFCGLSYINHFICELPVLLKLACDDTKFTKAILNGLAAFIILVPFSVILCSYGFILYSVFQMQSAAGWHKGFFTCGSHLVVVTLFYGPIIFMYIIPQSGSSPDLDKNIAVLYAVITPMLNPIIYTLRNKDVHKAMGKVLKRSSSEEK